MNEINLDNLQKHLGLKFNNIGLLTQALTHRSFIHENGQQNQASNERMEFLGDAVLELWTTQTLYQLYPEADEGRLTNLRALTVCTPNLAEISTKHGIHLYILLSRGEENNGGRKNQSILADAFEAVLGAVYLDQGQAASQEYLDRILLPTLKKIASQEQIKDPKSYFQEIVQAKEGITPHYQTLKESGPDHKKVFEVAVFVGDRQIAIGTGNSKQVAEADASNKATKIYQTTI